MEYEFCKRCGRRLNAGTEETSISIKLGVFGAKAFTLQ